MTSSCPVQKEQEKYMTKFPHRKALVALFFFGNFAIGHISVKKFSDGTPSSHTGSDNTVFICVLCPGAES
jgi:hypothetical protein